MEKKIIEMLNRLLSKPDIDMASVTFALHKDMWSNLEVDFRVRTKEGHRISSPICFSRREFGRNPAAFAETYYELAMRRIEQPQGVP